MTDDAGGRGGGPTEPDAPPAPVEPPGTSTAHHRSARAAVPWVLVAVVAAAVGAGLLGAANRHPLVADSLGYVTAGQRLAAGEGLSWHDDVNRIAGPFSSPMAYPVRTSGDGSLRFGYPVGFPLAIAAAVELTGRAGAATSVAPLFGGLTVAATAWLAWTATPSRWVAAGAALGMAAVPDLWRFGSDAWADVPAACLAAAGVAAVLAADRVPAARAAPALAAAAGALLAALCWVRPAGLALVVAVVLAGPVWWLATSRRLAVAFGVVLGAGVVGLGAFQASWFGSALSTGYSVEHGWYPHAALSLRYAFGESFIDGHSVPEALATSWHDLGPFLLVVPFGFVALGRRRGVLLAAAFAGAVAPYLVYAFAPTDENARFLLPAMPFAVVAAVAAVRVAARRRPPLLVGLVGLAAAGVLAVTLVPRSIDARSAADDTAAADAKRVADARAIAARLDPDTVVVSYAWNDAIAVYGDRSVLNVRRMPPGDVDQGRYRTDLLPGCLTGAVRALLDAGRPVAVVEGPTPPALDPLPILEEGFELEPEGEDPVIWHVVAPLEGAPAGSVEPCLDASVG